MHEGPPHDEENTQETSVPDMTNPEVLQDIAGRWRASVVDALRLQTPESVQLLDTLVASWEATVGESFVERVGHIRNIAQLYREAGLFERAFNALGDAAEMAYQEGQDDLCDQLEQEMADLKREAGRE